jgi:hypothetical protein
MGKTMKRLATSAAFAVLALGASAVHADEFDFILTGSGLAEITDAPGCTRYGCDPFVSAVWDGSVRVKLDGTGDGVYSADRIQSFAVESNWQSYTWLNGDSGLYWDNSVTVKNGVVTDLEFNWSIDAPHSEYFQVSTYPPGSSFISAVANGYCSGCGRSDAIGYHFPFGTLIAIPEADNAGLLLAGLCLMATRMRRRGSSR